MASLTVKRPSDPLTVRTHAELRQSRYSAYIKSDHWFRLRARLFAARGRTCEACGHTGSDDRPIDGHHLVYRDNLWRCSVQELMVLCRRCHDVAHTMRPFRPDMPARDRFKVTRKYIRRKLGIPDPAFNPADHHRWASDIRAIKRRRLRADWSF